MPGKADRVGGLRRVLAGLMQRGASIDPLNIPSVIDSDPAKNIVGWNFCSGEHEARGKDDNCTTVVNTA